MKAIREQQARLNAILDSRGHRGVAVVLEGRDTAGKSSTIREVTHYLNPALYSVHLSRKPSKSTMKKWLAYWSKRMPAVNQIVFYDRSWYSRAMVQKMNGWCSDTQYENFLAKHKAWEESQGVHLVKFWLSISEDEQRRRIEKRKNSPLTYWKFSENDQNALSYYDRMTLLKERVIDSDWHVIDYNEKDAGILAMLTRLCDILEADL
ncbi:MAG: polyphosphate kinase 2 family protein [Thalassobaculaceae bacterium]